MEKKYNYNLNTQKYYIEIVEFGTDSSVHSKDLSTHNGGQWQVGEQLLEVRVHVIHSVQLVF